jgi:hypothetical protein
VVEKVVPLILLYLFDPAAIEAPVQGTVRGDPPEENVGIVAAVQGTGEVPGKVPPWTWTGHPPDPRYPPQVMVPPATAFPVYACGLFVSARMVYWVLSVDAMLIA